MDVDADMDTNMQNIVSLVKIMPICSKQHLIKWIRLILLYELLFYKYFI